MVAAAAVVAAAVAAAASLLCLTLFCCGQILAGEGGGELSAWGHVLCGPDVPPEERAAGGKSCAPHPPSSKQTLHRLFK